jgi:hypothetical protein
MHATLARHGLIHAAECPARIVLAERGTSACTVVIGTHKIRYGITYARKQGLNIGTNAVIEPVTDIQRLSERYYAHVLPLIDPAASRSGARVHSDCGRDAVAVIKFEDDGDGGLMPCTLHIGKQTMSFDVDLVGDGDGRDIRFDDERH